MDDTYIAALETELEYAKRNAAGGQKPNLARIRVIETELKRARGDLETTDVEVLETTDGPKVKRRTEVATERA